MSVVVRMEMPKNNCEMAVEIKGAGDWCPIAARVCDYYSTKKMPDWCPIICSLPEKHGRLVDADANFLGVIHLGGGGFVNYNATIAEQLGEEDMRAVKVIVPTEK